VWKKQWVRDTSRWGSDSLFVTFLSLTHVFAAFMGPPRSTDEDSLKSRGKYDYLTCQELAAHLVNAKQLPPQCSQYRDVVTNLRRRETDTTHGTEVLS
jgi:hypothetical protein